MLVVIYYMLVGNDNWNSIISYFIVEIAPSVKIRVDKGSVYPSNENIEGQANLNR